VGEDGITVGNAVGSFVGLAVEGFGLGANDGSIVGFKLGIEVG
jgi:hypothetical protein